jgi:hypothetical protein
MQPDTLTQIERHLKNLPPEKLAVVLEFVRDLAQRALPSEGRAMALMSEAALRKIWDTPEEDEAWSHL